MTFPTSSKSPINLEKNFNINSFLYSLFYIQNQLRPIIEFQKNWKQNWKELWQPQVCILYHCQTLWNLTFSEEKRPGLKQTVKTAIVMVILCFHPVAKHELPPSLNLNHNAYSICLRIHVRRESMARGAKVHFNYARAQWMDFTLTEGCVLHKNIFCPITIAHFSVRIIWYTDRTHRKLWSPSGKYPWLMDGFCTILHRNISVLSQWITSITRTLSYFDLT